MVDRTVEFIDLFMFYPDLSSIPKFELKEGYSFRFFDGSDQDIDTWVEIEVSSGDVKTKEEGYEGFETYYRPYIEELKTRCIFLVNQEGAEVGTATGFFIVKPQPGLPKAGSNPLEIPENIDGHLHWVAIKEEYKGKGLSKPLITEAMKIMHQKGHKGAYLHTQTPS